MYFERLISNRFLQRDKHNFSRPLVNIATYTIALGVVVMIVSMCILRGFQREITNKIVGFGSHITIRSYGWVSDYDEMPVVMADSELAAVATLPEVRHVQPYAYKGGMLKTTDQIQGIIFKGVDMNFDTVFFAQHLVCGHLPIMTDSVASNDILVSQRLALKLGLDTGMKARTYFWSGNDYRARAFRIVGIYNTDLSEFDDHYLVGDLRQVQRLNGWSDNMVGGYELMADDFDRLDLALNEVKRATRPDLSVTSIREEHPSLFVCRDLRYSIFVLILSIMAVVCAASVVSALLIMIFEKTSMVGLLKTMGCTNRSVRRIFTLKAVNIVGKGLVAGNVVALAICLLQSRFQLIRLDSESYSMSFVPIDLNVWYFAAISAGTLLVCMLALLLPSTYIAHIHPARTVRVE